MIIVLIVIGIIQFFEASKLVNYILGIIAIIFGAIGYIIKFRKNNTINEIDVFTELRKSDYKNEKNENKNSNNEKDSYLAIGMCCGVSIGIAIGVVTDSMNISLALGICIGTAVGLLIDKIKNKG